MGRVLVPLGKESGQLVADPGPHPYPQGGPAEALGCFEPSVAGQLLGVMVTGWSRPTRFIESMSGVRSPRIAAVAFADDDG